MSLSLQRQRHYTVRDSRFSFLSRGSSTEPHPYIIKYGATEPEGGLKAYTSPIHGVQQQGRRHKFEGGGGGQRIGRWGGSKYSENTKNFKM